MTTLAAFSVAVLAVTLQTGPAVAAEDQVDPLAIVESQNLLGSEADLPQAALKHRSVQAQSNADSTEASARRVSISPVTDAPARHVDRVKATVHDLKDYGFVTGLGSGGTDASFIVIKNENAPGSYNFEIGQASNSLKLNTDGTVAVLDATGAQINFLREPWATDADGNALPTYYTVEGNVVTQHIDLSGAAFPVTADPTYGCGLNWCSIYFNRSETQLIRQGGPAGMAIIAAACGGAGWGGVAVCTAASGAIVGMAEIAWNQGKCVGVIGWWVPPLPVPGWNPFVEPRGTSHCP